MEALTSSQATIRKLSVVGDPDVIDVALCSQRACRESTASCVTLLAGLLDLCPARLLGGSDSRAPLR